VPQKCSNYNDFRHGVSYPLCMGELLLAKFITLFHDPPWKPWTITRTLPKLEDKMNVVDDYVCRYRSLAEKIDFGQDRAHERQATRHARALVCFLAQCCSSPPYHQVSKSLLSGMSERGDVTASAFDRIAVALSDTYCKRIGVCDQRKGLQTSIVGELFSPFRPELVWSSSLQKEKRLDVFQRSLVRFVRETLDRMCRACGCSGSTGCVDGLRRAYHVFSVLYEPLWHRASEGLYRGPADTRAPTHSVFDHLYASAAAANIAIYSGDEKKLDGVAGFVVYVGWRGVEEWVRSARKLSDMWVASWLATAMVWHAIGGLVWCLGPDVLLLPGFRWNPFYLALLRSRLGERVFEETVGDVARDFYMWEGFPYYAYMPANAVLLLPVLDRGASLEGCTGDERRLLEALKPPTSLGSANIDRMRELAEQMPGMAWRLEEALRERLREAWRHVIDVLIEAVEEARMCQPGRCSLLRALRLAREEPPMEPLVVVVPLMSVRVDDHYFITSNSCLNPDEAVNNISGFIVGGVQTDAADVAGSKVIQCSVLNAPTVYFNVRNKSSDKYHEYLIDIVVKLLYAGGFYRLVAEVGGGRGGPPRLWWASLVERRVPECRTPLGGRCGPRRWENCSVCRRGVAVFGMPGSDTRDGVTRDYEEAAEALGGGWRQWRPVFRPGEKLCPYCLVKRLAGLPRFFEAVAEALVGYRPPRRVVFPSTDDLAGLATKLAVLDVAVLLAALRGSERARRELARWLELSDEGFNKVVNTMDSDAANRIVNALSGLANVLSAVGYRSELHARLAEALQGGSKERIREAARRLVWRRWWTPRLLYTHASMAGRVLEDEDLSREALMGLAAALLFADMEVEAALEAPGVREALRDLGAALRAAARQARRAQLEGGKEAEEARGRLAEWLGVLAEAVQGPRVYYAAVGYDVDSIRDLLLGVSRRLEAGGEPLGPKEYLGELVESHWRV